MFRWLSSPDSNGWVTVVLLLMCTITAPLEASSDPDHPLLDRVSVSFGSFFSSVNTDLRADATDGRLGDRLDFETDLSLDDSETLFRVGLEFRIKRRHQINLGYYELSRSASRLLEREIRFGDRTFPISVDVEATFDSEVFELSYTYWLVLKDKVAFGIGAGGVNFFTFDAGLRAEDVNLGVIDGDAGTDVPLPLFGLGFRYLLHPKLRLRSSVRLIAISNVDDYSGDSVDFNTSLEYLAFKNFAFGLSYDFISLNVDAEKRGFFGDVEYRISGFQFYGRLRY